MQFCDFLRDWDENDFLRSKPAILGQTLHSVLDEMSDDTELFEKLLKSYPRRMAAVKAEKGGHTEY